VLPHLGVGRLLEQREDLLSPLAAKSRGSKGREEPEVPSPVRTEFQRDRDRIIHSKAFRRLKHKTQVFIAPPGDHYVTRLTHTIEVAQVARTIARALNLNEDLTEAIALGHDLGHTPFGHAGEELFAELLPEGFRHNYQSLRVVEVLERGGFGLNLTWEVRDGIVKSSKIPGDIQAEAWGVPETLEGQIVKLADAIAYINHDIGDAIRAGILSEQDLPGDATRVLGAGHSERINTLVCDIIDTSWAATGLVETAAPVRIGFSEPVARAANLMRDFLFAEVYHRESTLRDATRAQELLRFLWAYYHQHPQALPAGFSPPDDPFDRRVADYIAGMTDAFAGRTAARFGFKGLLPVALPA
jgi:dGTPase